MTTSALTGTPKQSATPMAACKLAMIDFALAHKGAGPKELNHALAAEEASYDPANCALALMSA